MKRPAAAVSKRPASANKRPAPAARLLPTLKKRQLTTRDVMMGGVWLGFGKHASTEDPGQDTADATVAAAAAAGILEFDTAPLYGAGSGEERLGRAVAKLPPELRKEVRVITKAGRLLRQPDGKTPCPPSVDSPGSTQPLDRVVVNDFTAAGARLSLVESLARMQLPSVHGLRIHDPNDNGSNDGSVDDVAVAMQRAGMCPELRRMREEGVILNASLGMNSNREQHQGVPEEIIRLIRGAGDGTFDSALLAGGWNLLTQAGLPCLMECERHNIAVHVGGVFASGLLVGVDRYAYKAAPPDMVEKALKWRALVQGYGLSLPAVAIAFAALPAVVTRVVIGMGTAAQVEENVAAVAESNTVPLSLWVEARKAGLIDAGVPLPAGA